MNRVMKIAIALGVVSGFALCAQSVNSAGAGYTAQAKVMSEYKGVKLGMKRDAVKAALGNPENPTDTSDEFKLITIRKALPAAINTNCVRNSRPF